MTETFESIKKRKMKDLGPEPEIPNGEPNNNIECKDLLELLTIHAAEINRMLKKYRASVDNSGAIPQLITSEK